eukprot:1391846-Amorphochlora_amoeboformis.AAC.1
MPKRKKTKASVDRHAAGGRESVWVMCALEELGVRPMFGLRFRAFRVWDRVCERFRSYRSNSNPNTPNSAPKPNPEPKLRVAALREGNISAHGNLLLVMVMMRTKCEFFNLYAGARVTKTREKGHLVDIPEQTHSAFRMGIWK